MARTSPLRITLSTTNAVLRSATSYAEIAARAGLAGVDLDTTTWIGRRMPGIRSISMTDLAVPISSIWIAQADLVALCRSAAVDSLDSTQRGKRELVVRLVDSAASAQDQVVVQQAFDLVRSLSWAERLTIACPAIAIEGGRAHLSRIRNLRRLAEEWGAGLGIDVGARSDTRWEAEAAIQAAGKSLTLIRISTSVETFLQPHSDFARRTLRAAFDGGFRGGVSVAPATPIWRAWHDGSMARDIDAALELVSRSTRPRTESSALPDASRTR